MALAWGRFLNSSTQVFTSLNAARRTMRLRNSSGSSPNSFDMTSSRSSGSLGRYQGFESSIATSILQRDRYPRLLSTDATLFGLDRLEIDVLERLVVGRGQVAQRQLTAAI